METKTDDEGVYTFSNLPPGTYTITAIASGYPKWIAGHLKVIIPVPSKLSETKIVITRYEAYVIYPR